MYDELGNSMFNMVGTITLVVLLMVIYSFFGDVDYGTKKGLYIFLFGQFLLLFLMWRNRKKD